MKAYIADHFDGIMITLIVLALIGVFFGIYYDQKAWDRWSVQHGCEVRGYTSPSNGLGIGPKGEPVVTYNPSQTIYVCDEGHTIITR